MDSNKYPKDFLKNMAYVAIIIFIVVITVFSSLCALTLLYPSITISDYATSITAITTFFAFGIAYREYCEIKDSKQAQVLSEYNKRYSEDPNIIKVVKYLNFIDEDGNINNPQRDIPSNYEIEMFMRFFEEVELQIRSGRLNDIDVNNLFAYYAYMLGKKDNQALRNSLGVTEKDYKDNWDGFKKFVNNYRIFKNL